MKIILSRKGFDNTSGGYPSFIIDDKLISIPIPDEHTSLSYNSLNICGYNIGNLFESAKITPKLNNKNITTCHLDPDIENGLFGQCSASAQHLLNNEVDIKDLFLFFGWFRKFNTNDYSYDNTDKFGKHCIYAYFQIGEILDLNNSIDKKYALKLSNTHPHIIYKSKEYSKINLLFVASQYLLENINIKGCGRLKYSAETTLTKPNASKSIWKLPKCFLDTKMSYHNNCERWYQLDNEFCELKSVCRGQEFVVSENADVLNWAKNLIQNNIDCKCLS